MTLKPREEIEKEVRKQLNPLFFDFYGGSPTYKMYYRYEDQISQKIERAVDYLKTLVETQRKMDVNPKAKSLLDAIECLSDVELIGNVFVDMTILLLIAKGRDLHMEPDYKHRYTRHATSLEDLESPTLPLSIKLDFLESNGLPFFTKWIDRDLRNKIAHLNFEIDNDGKFFLLTRKGRKEVNLSEKIQNFTSYLAAVRHVFHEQIERTKKPES
jgi:hypothetical protein